jgi:hypothetical protein
VIDDYAAITNEMRARPVSAADLDTIISLLDQWEGLNKKVGYHGQKEARLRRKKMVTLKNSVHAILMGYARQELPLPDGRQVLFDPHEDASGQLTDYKMRII